jgi:hypothetical protein
MKKFFSKKELNKLKKNTIRWCRNKDNQFMLIGFFFLVLQFFVFLANYKADRYDVFFWFCNHTPLFFAFAFFLKKRNVIKGLINVGFLGQFAWTLDFLGKLFFDYHIFNMTNYVFENPNGLWVLVPIGIHVLATNIALVFTYKRKPNLLTAFYSLLYIIFLYAGTLTYTLPERNVNWVFKLGGTINYAHPLYTNAWPIIVFFLVAMPTQALQYFLYKWSVKKKKK